MSEQSTNATAEAKKSTVEEEIEVISLCVKRRSELDQGAQQRAMHYLKERLGVYLGE